MFKLKKVFNYLNKNLSGAGVTWQFCRFYEQYYFAKEALELQYVYQLMDLAAVGIIGDCMDMRSFENRAFSYWGLWTIYNPFLKAIFIGFVSIFLNFWLLLLKLSMLFL